MGVNLEKREIYDTGIDYHMINSGDFLAITRLDGLDQIIGYGTGGIAGHSTLALWFPEEDGTKELYVIESQDAWYWPT